MSRQDREIESRMKVKRAINNITGLVKKYEAKENEIIALAAQAKKDGRLHDYKNTVITLKMYIARKEKTKSMLHQLQLSEIMRDDAKMSGEYLDAMKVLAEETSKIYLNNDLKKVAKTFRKSSVVAEKNRTKMDIFLDEVEDSYRALTDLDGDITVDAELQARIDAQVEGISSRIDDEISKMMDSLK